MCLAAGRRRATSMAAVVSPVCVDASRLPEISLLRSHDAYVSGARSLGPACWDHPVARCSHCGGSFRSTELAADLLTGPSWHAIRQGVPIQVARYSAA